MGLSTQECAERAGSEGVLVKEEQRCWGQQFAFESEIQEELWSDDLSFTCKAAGEAVW